MSINYNIYEMRRPLGIVCLLITAINKYHEAIIKDRQKRHTRTRTHTHIYTGYKHIVVVTGRFRIGICASRKKGAKKVIRLRRGIQARNLLARVLESVVVLVKPPLHRHDRGQIPLSSTINFGSAR